CLEQVLRSVVEGVGGLMNSNLQDDEVGDGTTFMVVWPRELLREVEKLLSMKIQPMTIVYLYGAHVISWKNEHNEKMIFASSKCFETYESEMPSVQEVRIEKRIEKLKKSKATYIVFGKIAIPRCLEEVEKEMDFLQQKSVQTKVIPRTAPASFVASAPF
ncbi:T-complex protein 1 subunit beta-like protein, partial [Tanacetum coccineum]